MRITFVKSERLDLLSGAGLNLVGQILDRHTTLRKDLNRQFLKQPHGLEQHERWVGITWLKPEGA